MLRYEMKKFFSKTINKVILTVLLLVTIILGFLAAGNIFYADMEGKSLTGISKLTAGRRIAADKNRWRGELTTERLAEIGKSYHELKQQYPEEIPDAEYGGIVQSYDDILYFAAKVYTPESDFIGDARANLTEEDMIHLYDTYAENLRKMPEEYGGTPEKEEYLRKQYGKIEIPVTYEAYDSWDTMLIYAETYVIILAVAIGFLAAGIFDEEFRNHAELVFFTTKYGRSKAAKNKIVVGMTMATIVFWAGVGLLSLISFGIMGVSGFDTPYQIVDPYSSSSTTLGQNYLLLVGCGYIASLLSASVTMLVTARMRSEKVAVCIPFFMYIVLLFIAGALSKVTKIVYFTPDVLVNIVRAVKVQFIFQIGSVVFRQIPFVMGIYFAVSVLLLPFIYKSYARYGLTKKVSSHLRKRSSFRYDKRNRLEKV